MENKKIVFFGGEPLGIPALEALAAAGIIPQLIVCSPDRPAPRPAGSQTMGANAEY